MFFSKLFYLMQSKRYFFNSEQNFVQFCGSNFLTYKPRINTITKFILNWFIFHLLLFSLFFWRKTWFNCLERFHKIWEVLQNLRGFTKSERLYEIWEVLQNLIGFTKSERFYKIREVLQNLRGFTKSERFYKIWEALQNLRGFTKSERFYKI